MNLLDRLTYCQQCAEQLAQAMTHERHLRRAVRQELLTAVEEGLSWEDELVSQACAAATDEYLDADFLVDRARLRRAMDALARSAVDGAEFEERADEALAAVVRHGEHQARWLVPFVTDGLEAA